MELTQKALGSLWSSSPPAGGEPEGTSAPAAVGSRGQSGPGCSIAETCTGGSQGPGARHLPFDVFMLKPI